MLVCRSRLTAMPGQDPWVGTQQATEASTPKYLKKQMCDRSS
jgi:hypothetical protein